MRINSETYLNRLREYYKTDAVSLKRLDSYMSSVQNVHIIQDFKSNDYAKKILEEAVDRYKTEIKRLYTDRKLTDHEREFIFISIDWAFWYIAFLAVTQKRSRVT